MINVIDLFAGCGGLTDGFVRTKAYKTLAAVDWEYPTVNTLRNRLSDKWGYTNVEEKVIHFDIQRTEELINGFKDDKYGKSVGLNKLIGKKKVDLIVGGPPCQAYSIAGRVRDTNGMHDDYRNYLFESYAKMVDVYQPKAFIFENVEGILSASPGGISIVDRITSEFNKIGYDISTNLREEALFDTSYYNVPQKRKRVIIFGVRQSDSSQSIVDSFYNKLSQKASKEPLNAEYGFANLPKIIPVRSKEKRKSHEILDDGIQIPPNHEPRFHSERDIETFKVLTADIESGTNKYATSSALINLYEEITGKRSKFHKYHVIKNNKPSNTIPAHLYKDGLRHIHPDSTQARSITVREAGRLQSFDDDFVFLGSKGDQYKMIGNAVPPNFAAFIAETVRDVITTIR